MKRLNIFINKYNSLVIYLNTVLGTNYITLDDSIVNVEDECPYCMSNDGYTIVGEIKEWSPEVETEIENAGEEPAEEVTEEEVDTEFTEGLKARRRKKIDEAALKRIRAKRLMESKRKKLSEDITLEPDAEVEVPETDVAKLVVGQTVILNFNASSTEGRGYVTGWPAIGELTSRGASIVKATIHIDDYPPEILPNYSFTGKIQIEEPVDFRSVEPRRVTDWASTANANGNNVDAENEAMNVMKIQLNYRLLAQLENFEFSQMRVAMKR